jgi:hypothetical protein
MNYTILEIVDDVTVILIVIGDQKFEQKLKIPLNDKTTFSAFLDTYVKDYAAALNPPAVVVDPQKVDPAIIAIIGQVVDVK